MAALVGVPLALALAACGSDTDAGAKPALPTETPALWNPCDGLDEAFISDAFGTPMTKSVGSLGSPECRFTPAEGSGAPALTANYQLFRGTLEEFWTQMGQGDDADVRDPKVPGADAARIVVAAEKDQLYVTGFVQNGELFELVNVVDPAPYDAKKMVRATEATLAALTRHADEANAGAPASTAAAG